MICERTSDGWQLRLRAGDRGRWPKALLELMSLLIGEDRLTVAGGRLIVERRRGPFRTTRSFDRDTIRRVLLAGRGDRLVLERERGRVELSALGTREERSAAVAVLQTKLSLSKSGTAAQHLPDRWEEIITPEGERAIVPNLAIRRSQAWLTGVITMMAGTVTFLIARGIPRELVLVVPMLLVSVLTLALAVGTVWLARGRMEWRIGNGRLVLRRRFGASARDVFEGHSLVLDETTDSDGDFWYDLGAIGASEDEERSPPIVAGSAAARSRIRVWVRFGEEHRRTIAKVMNDASGLRDLGRWLAAAAGIEFEDRTTAEPASAIGGLTVKFVSRSDTRRAG